MIRPAHLAVSLAAFFLTAAGAQAYGDRESNWVGLWPPEPFLSQAIAEIEHGNPLWSFADQAFLDGSPAANGMGCLQGSLGCSDIGPFGPFVLVSAEATRWAACVVLVHEVAHGLGWDGRHTGGTTAPNRCPLSPEVRP